MKSVGHVSHADIMLDQNGRSKGCGIVVFANAGDASRAIDELNGASFEGRNVLCRMDKFSA
jgi:RNA recognition motif-containing protein